MAFVKSTWERFPTDHPVRYVMFSNFVSPDVVEYPDIRELSVMAITESQLGGPLWHMRSVDEPST